MRVPRKLRATVLAATAIAAIGLTGGEAMASVSLSYVGRAISGDGNMGSEISAYSPSTKRLFVTNGATKKVDIFSLANPASPTKVKSVTLSGLGDLQSVATNGSLVAVAAYTDATDGKYLPGRVFLMNTDGTVDPRAPQGIAVGALPDSVHFAPDGNTIVVANEGEPKTYCQTSGEFVDANDPKGSVSIIDTSAATLTATTLEFTAFNAQAAAIRSAGARIFGPGADVDQDLEPEYIAISADSKTAYVTLQENNAVAEVNLATKTITRIMGLGYKDHSVAGKGLDLSDEDSATNADTGGGAAISIRQMPVFGMYQPDAIGTFTGADGTSYFVTANEGDGREYECLLGGSGAQDEVGTRLRALGLDANFVDRTNVAFDSNAGRVSPTRFGPTAFSGTGTTYGGSSIAPSSGAGLTAAYILGARSLSIFKAPAANGVGSAVLVGDSGDTIEQKILILSLKQDVSSHNPLGRTGDAVVPHGFPMGMQGLDGSPHSLPSHQPVTENFLSHGHRLAEQLQRMQDTARPFFSNQQGNGVGAKMDNGLRTSRHRVGRRRLVRVGSSFQHGGFREQKDSQRPATMVEQYRSPIPIRRTAPMKQATNCDIHGPAASIYPDPLPNQTAPPLSGPPPGNADVSSAALEHHLTTTPFQSPLSHDAPITHTFRPPLSLR